MYFVRRVVNWTINTQRVRLKRGRNIDGRMAERSRKLWTTRGVLMVKHAFYSKPFPQFSPDFPLTWWRRMALSTVSFVVDTRIDHRFAIQTELNDGPLCRLSALFPALSPLPFRLPFPPSTLSTPYPSLFLSSLSSLAVSFLDRVSTYPLFFREKKGKRAWYRLCVNRAISP